MRRCWRREEVQESQGPRVPRSRGPKVPRSQGPKDQDISNSHSNTSLTLKKVHLVLIFFEKKISFYTSFYPEFYSLHFCMNQNCKLFFQNNTFPEYSYLLDMLQLIFRISIYIWQNFLFFKFYLKF